MEIQNFGKKSGVIDANVNNRIQEIEERISDAEDHIENIDSSGHRYVGSFLDLQSCSISPTACHCTNTMQFLTLLLCSTP